MGQDLRTYPVLGCQADAPVDESPVLGRFDLEVCLIQSLEYLPFDTLGFLGRRPHAGDCEADGHATLVEMGRHPVVTPASGDGIAKEPPWAYPRGVTMTESLE